jgi:predicted membrane-bound spermidine synthase
LARRGDGTRRLDTGAVAALQAIAALAPLGLFWAAETLPRFAGPAVGQGLFAGLALLCGLLGGYQFSVASTVFFSSAKRSGLGTLYALDLVGAGIGAVLFSVYLVPVFGFLRTALLAGGLNLVPAALAMAAGREPLN